MTDEEKILLKREDFSNCPFCGEIPMLGMHHNSVWCISKGCPILHHHVSVEEWNKRPSKREMEREGDSRFEVDMYCEDTFKSLYGFPENSYYYENEKDLVECISGLANNKISGIYKCEITLNDFKKEEKKR